MRIVLALGGNALQADPKDKTSEAQLKTCKETSKSIVDLIEEGHEVAIVHGNGPQVGQILSTVEVAHKSDKENVLFPFDVCGAFSQGYIGYHLQRSISEELMKRRINRNVATVITQIIVDIKDEGFKNPTKPIGSFYSKEEANLLTKEKGYIMKEDAGRGHRRVVPSPKPLDIVEKDMIKKFVEDKNIVISCGGGGIPVVKEGNEYRGVSAVIDKDFAAAKLAEIIDADMLMILTGVDRVCINYNTPNQKELVEISIKELDLLIEEGHFAPGSMLPKVMASRNFVENKPLKYAVISSLANAKQAILGESGTKVKG